tara:strand:- start:157 stop:579 length:423 start_codon:yes stop_codon:yes gene_type:complete
MEPRSSTDYIVIHCAATKPSMDIGADTIRDWHVNGNGWRDIGYHLVIKRNGDVEKGRDINDSGAHAAGYNSKSIGLCLVGGMAEDNSAEDNFTAQQWTSLLATVKELLVDFPEAKVIGHNEISEKECPSFDVQKWKGDNL